jgi:hypothetical protein
MTTPLPLSEIMIRNPDARTFADLLRVIAELGEKGGVLMSIDIKPDYRDTPRNWETLVENAFTFGDC